MSESLSINLDENSASLSISKDIYLRILTKAISQTKQDISDLETALTIDDFDTLQSIAHRLKGDYDNMRITTLSNIAKEMNENSKTTKDKDAFQKLLSEFKKYFDQLHNYINSQGT